MKIVLKIGGSVLCPAGKPDLEFVRKISTLILELSKKYQLAIVTGAGKLGKDYIKIARKFGVKEQCLDWIGIEVARLNARILISVLGKRACPKVVKNLEELTNALKSDKIVVMGGLTPKITTDAVAAKVADIVGAELIIKVSDVNGVYDKDPDKYKDAKIFDHISPEELSNIVEKEKFIAGQSLIVDPVAVKIIQKSKIPMLVVGSDIENIKKFIEKKRYVGTLISSQK